MTIVRVPHPQPNNGILTVKEYLLDPKAPFHLVAIHDGWSPLCVRSLEHALYLCVLADTSRAEEGEVFHLLLPGDDLRVIEKNSIAELAFIGQTFDGRYLFLEVKPEEDGVSPRRVGRLDLEESGS